MSIHSFDKNSLKNVIVDFATHLKSSLRQDLSEYQLL